LDKKFTSDEVPLGQLLEQARTGSLQLPDFQRGWVWDDNGIKSLLASISLSYPIGAVMTLQTGNPDVRFRPRLLEGVTLDKAVEPDQGSVTSEISKYLHLPSWLRRIVHIRPVDLAVEQGADSGLWVGGRV